MSLSPPPWWETWWFRGAAWLALLGLVIGGYRWRVVAAERRSRELQVQVVERTQDLSERTTELAALAESLRQEISGRERAEQILSRQVEALSALNQIAQMVTTMTDLETALGMVSRRVAALFDACFVYCLLSSEGKDQMIRIQGYDRKTDLLEPLPLDPALTDNSQFRWLFSLSESVAVCASDRLPQSLADSLVFRQVLGRDVPQADSTLEALSQLLPSEVSEALTPGNINSFMLVPLEMRGATVGIMFVATDRVDRSYTASDVSLAETIAGDIASGVENIRLMEKSRALAVAEERTRLAREMHDSVTQTIYSVSMMADALPQIWDRSPAEAKRNLVKLRQMTLVALTEMRALLFELHPSALRDASLEALLHQLKGMMVERGRIPVELAIKGEGDISKDIKVALYRTAQEACSNVLKHAEATQVVITLQKDPEQTILTICDNGQGFDTETVPAEHYGIGIMRERNKGIGANLHIESAPGKGTRVSVTWPDPEVRL